MTTFEELGGREILVKASKIFYDKVYAHPWIGKFFQEIDQEFIESQQVDFLQGALGGKKVYGGRFPIPAHSHMYITNELYDLRSRLLLEALKEANACDALIEKIEQIDQSFRGGLVKESVDCCKKRYTTDELLLFPNPEATRSDWQQGLN